MREEDPADPLWPFPNPPWVEPVSQFPSFFFWVFSTEGASTQHSRWTWGSHNTPGILMLMWCLELSHNDKFLYKGQWVFLFLPMKWHLYTAVTGWQGTKRNGEFCFHLYIFGRIASAGCLLWSFLKYLSSVGVQLCTLCQQHAAPPAIWTDEGSIFLTENRKIS